LIDPVYSRIDAFLVTGSSNRRHYEDHGVPTGKCFRFPWAIDNERFWRLSREASTERMQRRHSWGVSGDKDVLLFVGRLVEEKRPMDLLLAAQRLDNVHVVLAGGGPLGTGLEAFVRADQAGRCTFLGFVNQAELPAVYGAADLVVLPSSYEPWGLVVNESLACGTPVAASRRVGAAYDLLPENLRFEPGDVDGICQAVEHWRALRDSYGGDLRSWARQSVLAFSFEEDAVGLRQALEWIARDNGRKKDDGWARPGSGVSMTPWA
jgi:glycosyltransferase involved in cell wall biosynthesis